MSSFFAGAALIMLVLVSTGCVASQYKRADRNVPPAIPLGLAAQRDAASPTLASPLHAVVENVIVYQGPGSWKRSAYWDEYVLSLVNRNSTAPITLESVTLFDFQSTPTAPGSNPWELEKQSHRYEARLLANTGTAIQIGAGSLAATSAAFAIGTTMVTATSGYVGAGVAIASAGIVLPAYAVGTIFANVHSRHRIEDQFNYRGLKLPVTIAADRAAQGSLFFRITPGPQRLVLHYRTGEQTGDVTVDLAPLSQLHLKKTTATESKSP